MTGFSASVGGITPVSTTFGGCAAAAASSVDASGFGSAASETTRGYRFRIHLKKEGTPMIRREEEEEGRRRG
jgi:hypothetical protein